MTHQYPDHDSLLPAAAVPGCWCGVPPPVAAAGVASWDDSNAVIDNLELILNTRFVPKAEVWMSHTRIEAPLFAYLGTKTKTKNQKHMVHTCAARDERLAH